MEAKVTEVELAWNAEPVLSTILFVGPNNIPEITFLIKEKANEEL